ncbi:hypothetical protein AOQ84DRAFT_295676 [Glonium stellatum]|uniref:UDP-N-acetylglucosamine transferase subunit ALG13 n=1 Tax=Glonium stellatum TaxID=574774 RepID=A0A8E2EYC2_9PEZI|nr:hypothetical protein AOQ84DRAFT_295676 [Glonium stellatum]
MSVDEKKQLRLCFVTIGATAAFNSLISACLEPRFLESLSGAGYTNLLIQYGKEGKAIFDKITSEIKTTKKMELVITGFDFNHSGLDKEMGAAKGGPNDLQGVVISHAGSGSILHALRISVPIIVVPNPDLLDNHQVELAEELESQGYVVHGKLNNLPAAILESEELRKRSLGWPPVNSGRHGRAADLAGVMDEEMGFLD